jgi:hypothetical protein
MCAHDYLSDEWSVAKLFRLRIHEAVYNQPDMHGWQWRLLHNGNGG